MHKYCSSQQSGDIIFETVQQNIPDLELVMSSPKKKRTYVYAKTKQTGSTRGCRVCGKSNDCCCWIGCGCKTKMTKAEDCNYWVQQWCIELH